MKLQLANMGRDLTARLIEYAKIDTQTIEESQKTPSSEGQWKLAQLLSGLLSAFGLNVEVDDNCYLYAHLCSNISASSVPPVGFNAHLDTNYEVPAANVRPIVHTGYSGGPIHLNGGTVIAAKDLEQFIGQTIITSSGTTLLGGDDKAGIAEIVTAMEILAKSRINHGDVYVVFSPDEEQGHMVGKLTPEKFPVSAAYAFDGGGGSLIQAETFHAIKATVTFKGVNTHPGEGGYHQLLNAQRLYHTFFQNIPITQFPETSQGREGFYHQTSVSGGVEEVTAVIHIRDFDQKQADGRVQTLRDFEGAYNRMYGAGTVVVRSELLYRNMKEEMDKHPEVVDIAFTAAKLAGVDAQSGIIRGGIDGSAFTLNYGIPCPNIFSGQHNIHSLREFAVLSEMEQATKTILNIVEVHRNYHLKKSA